MAYIPPPEVVALIRRRYHEGATIKAIVAESGISNLDILYGCVEGRYPDGTAERPAPLQKRKPGMRVRHRKGSRGALVARMWRAAERQVEEIEERLTSAGLPLADHESTARTLAVVAKTLRELSAVDAAQAPGKSRKQPTDQKQDDDPVPADIDEFRRELTRRIEALVGTGTDPESTGRPPS